MTRGEAPSKCNSASHPNIVLMICGIDLSLEVHNVWKVFCQHLCGLVLLGLS